MKKILVFSTGGTICSAVNEKGALEVSENRGLLLVSEYEKAHGFPKFEVSENLFILSENMSLEKWEIMINKLVSALERESYDGVIVLHGTDTLAYTASLFSLFFADLPIPVFFVSSAYPLHSPLENGRENFRLAVELIEEGIEAGVFVVFKNYHDGKILLHLGSRIRQCEAYSNDFHSAGEIEIKSIADTVERVKKTYKKEGRHPVFKSGGVKLENKVLLLSPYPSLDYEAFDYSRFCAVLHTAYHSGTVRADGKSSFFDMVHKCRALGVGVYLFPTKNEGEIYDTLRRVFECDGVNFLYGTTPETAFAKLILGYNVGSLDRALETEINYENIEV